MPLSTLSRERAITLDEKLGGSKGGDNKYRNRIAGFNYPLYPTQVCFNPINESSSLKKPPDDRDDTKTREGNT